jgi:NADH-quinone oxidoreductase subunit N
MIYGLLLIPFAATAIVWMLRSLRFAAAISAAAVLLGLSALLVVGIGSPPAIVLGRTLELYAPVRIHLAINLTLLAIVFLATWRLPENSMGWMFALMATGFLMLSLAIQNVTLSVLMLNASLVTMTMAIPAEGSATPLAGLRALAILTGAGLLMIAGAWIIEQPLGEGTPGQLGPILLFLGYWISIGAFPFFVWRPPIFRGGASAAHALFGIVLPYTLLIQVVLQQRTLLASINALVPALFLYAGMATFVLASLGVVAQQSLSSMLAYVALAELGAAVMALGAGTPVGNALAVTLLIFRGIAFVAMSIGIRILRQSMGSDDLENMRGAFSRAPLTVIGVILGGLSLAGFPPLAGFITRFSLYRMVALEQLPWAIVLIIAGLLPALTLTRFATRAFQIVPVPGSRREPLWPALLVVGMGGLLLVLGLMPQAMDYLPRAWSDLLFGLTITG